MVIENFDIKQKIRDSILLLIERDSYLLKCDAHERAIAHRLALYMEPKFNGWNIDCEYNRDYHDDASITKKLPEHLLKEAERDETKEKTVIPDIIVHHRGPGDNNNLLAIEIKKTSNSTPDRDNFDYLKLMAFKSELKYDHSLFIKFNTGIYFKEGSMDINDNVTIEWDPVAKSNLTSRKAPGCLRELVQICSQEHSRPSMKIVISSLNPTLSSGDENGSHCCGSSGLGSVSHQSRQRPARPLHKTLFGSGALP
jgi:hypothetical protein